MNDRNTYLKNNIEGMSNDELILFIYQELIKILNLAKHYFKENNIEKRVNSINKAIEIISTLMSILNFEQGGQIALRLRSLYLYSIQKLTTANYDKKPGYVDEAIKIFKELHAGWKEKLKKDKLEGIKTNPIKPDINNQVKENNENLNSDVKEGKGFEIYG